MVNNTHPLTPSQKGIVRTRFAPSPTGFMHVGNLKPVLYDYLIAKKYNGKLIFRLEDTDQKREVHGSKEALKNIFKIFNFQFDEGPSFLFGSNEDRGEYGPYIQSQRKEIYDKYNNELLEKGEAYYCFCTMERLEEMRKSQQEKGLPPRYDRHCRNLTKEEVTEKIKNGEKFVIRQKMPLKGDIIVQDELRGDIKFNAQEIDDQVLIKADGMPTYQFANVIDDHLMKISHVVRGSEWIPSLPKNILLYQAFGWEAPKYIHTALILNKEGGKLGKRQGDVSVDDFLKKGYLPEALLNFNVLLGWHPRDDNEILSLSDMIEKFEIKDMRVSGAVFDLDKLDYFNGYYIRQKDLDELTNLCIPYLESSELIKKTNGEFVNLKTNKEISFDFIKRVVNLERERMKKLSEIGELTTFIFCDKIEYPKELLIWKKLSCSNIKNNLKIINELLEKIPENSWTNNSIEEGIINYLKNNNLKVGDYLWPMRVALSGLKASPSPFDIAEVLGKDESLKRINKATIKLE